MVSQRKDALEAHFAGPDAATRPILTLLNGDNSWLISFPVPPTEAGAADRPFFHVVVDPWLVSPAVTLSPWLVWIDRTEPPAAADGAAVEELAREIDGLALATAVAAAARGRGYEAGGLVEGGRATPPPSQSQLQSQSRIGAIIVTIELTDHNHEPTLRTLDAAIPVVAGSKAAASIRGYGHFDTVVAMRDIPSPAADEGGGFDWGKLHPSAVLPAWLSVFRLPGHRELNFAAAIVWSPGRPRAATGEGEEVVRGRHEALLISPHGILADRPSVQALVEEAEPKIDVTAMMHGMKDSFGFGLRFTLGVSGGLALERKVRPRYWVKTHDQRLWYAGLALRLSMTTDYFRTMDEGLNEEKRKCGGKWEGRRPNFIEVENGGSFVLA